MLNYSPVYSCCSVLICALLFSDRLLLIEARLPPVSSGASLSSDVAASVAVSVAASVTNISISGATGFQAHLINGIWNRSGEVVAGQQVYFKRDNANCCLEYFAPNWWIRSLDKRGTNTGWAYVNCAAGVPLDNCTNVWKVAENGTWVDQYSMNVVRHADKFCVLI